MGTIFIVLAYYGDGSLQGDETVLAVFPSRDRADRFVELAEKLYPSKTLCIAVRNVEP